MNLCTISGIEPSIEPDISITQIIQIHFRYFHFRYSSSTSGFSKSFQINAKYKHTPLIVVLHCYRMILANTCRNTYSRCYLAYTHDDEPIRTHWQRPTTVGDRAFPVAASRIWNALPRHVTSAPSLAIFRRHLKTHLFRRCFP